MSRAELDPTHIMQVGMGFWPSKVVLSAVELELFTQLGPGSMSGPQIGERLGLHPRAIYDFLDTLVALRLLERDGDGDGRLSQHPSDRCLSGQAERVLHRRHPGDVQFAAVSLLGRSQRGAEDRPASERNQAHGQADVRRAVQRPGEAAAVHGGHARHLARQLPGPGREVRLLEICDGLRCWRRQRPALHDLGRTAPAPALYELRPARRRADRQGGDSGCTYGRPSDRRLGRLLGGTPSPGGRHHDGPDPPRLEPRPKDAPDLFGLRGPPRRWCVHRHREPHR